MGRQMKILQTTAKAMRRVMQTIAAANAKNSTRHECGTQSKQTLDEHPTFNLGMEDK